MPYFLPAVIANMQIRFAIVVWARAAAHMTELDRLATARKSHGKNRK